MADVLIDGILGGAPVPGLSPVFVCLPQCVSLPKGMQNRMRHDIQRTAPFSISSREAKEGGKEEPMTFFQVAHHSESMNGVVVSSPPRDMAKGDLTFRRTPLETGESLYSTKHGMPDSFKGGREMLGVMNANAGFPTEVSLVPSVRVPSRIKEVMA